ncbi:ParB/RepB/Spo0J family partition protein [Rickettsia argasii]|uniref:ParB/RepB/Spo0J family partition protein n=1 Tax=Rickettsia argasii TaxID=1441385 RepID=UPI0009E4E52B|nr:ParB/RepB/Spo0J family partition protein [Rickettsia argasii]
MVNLIQYIIYNSSYTSHLFITPFRTKPVHLRLREHDPKFKYEVIAGSRRWKACLDADLPLRAVINNVTDEGAAIIQIKENQGLDICDYSKGLYYSKLLEDHKITQESLANNINASRAKLTQFLTFNKVPKAIWNAVGNMSKVSSRTSATIYSLSQKGDHVISILINLAEEIKKGIGCTKLENLVNQILLSNDSDVLQDNMITLPSGATIGIWKNNTLKLSKDVNVDKEHFVKYIIKYFAKESKNK